MGAYLSEPLTDKTSSDETKDRISCGSSSMQGWRVSQEDAHNHIIDFDNETSLFAVYDGHGGAEVAKYCAMKLPEFIKGTEAYKEGNYPKALEDAFLGFDATISSPEIIELLTALSDNADMEAEADENTDEEEEVHNLFEEASMPLDKIMAKYQEGKVNLLNKLTKPGDEVTLSPFLRCKRQPGAKDSGAGCSSKLAPEEAESDVSSSCKDSDAGTASEAQVSTSNGDEKVEVENTETNGIHEKASSAEASTPDSSVDVAPSSNSDTAEVKDASLTIPKEDHCNGEVTNSKSELKDSVTSSSQENGEVNSSPSKKGKTLAKKSVVSSSETNSVKTESNRPNKRAAATLYNSLLEVLNGSEDDESDSNDETFEGKDEASSSEDEATSKQVGGDSSDGEEEEEEDSSDDSNDDEQDEMDAFNMMIKNEPGSNSGCTAVVALLQKDKLYVANAGDSRCVVCRDGKAIDMSIDHKPEDKEELDRITKAGGKVSSDGRVNGGLNLSRAIGDLGYKQNKELGAKEQMITAFPDVKTLDIDTDLDEFIVLACDGIWNSMTSQEVVTFVRCRLAKGVEKLSTICEEMFEHCLSPNTQGDGTGCDNMTAVIVKLKDIVTKKRPSDDDATEENSAKRTKTEENVSVSSSV